MLGYDANNTPIRYAVVTDPNGAIQLPYATSAHLVVDLDADHDACRSANATNAIGVAAARAAGTARASTVATAKCFGILSGTGAGRTGMFFGPDGDLDCDHAQPECDDTWYLRVRDPSKCATTMPPTNDATTMDACRLGSLRRLPRRLAGRGGVRGAGARRSACRRRSAISAAMVSIRAASGSR